MADTAKRLAGPTQLGTTESTLYTVPSSTTTIVRTVHVANTSAAGATLKLSIGADAAGTELFGATLIPANSVMDWSTFLVLAAAETLRGLAGTASALTITVSGVEVT